MAFAEYAKQIAYWEARRNRIRLFIDVHIATVVAGQMSNFLFALRHSFNGKIVGGRIEAGDSFENEREKRDTNVCDQ